MKEIFKKVILTFTTKTTLEKVFLCFQLEDVQLDLPWHLPFLLLYFQQVITSCWPQIRKRRHFWVAPTFIKRYSVFHRLVLEPKKKHLNSKCDLSTVFVFTAIASTSVSPLLRTDAGLSTLSNFSPLGILEKKQKSTKFSFSRWSRKRFLHAFSSFSKKQFEQSCPVFKIFKG